MGRVLLVWMAGLLLGLAAEAQAQVSIFARYAGIEGESTDGNHSKWVDVLSVDWGLHESSTSAGAARNGGRRTTEIRDLTLNLLYEKAAPKLLEKCVSGDPIPLLELEFTDTYGGARATFLRYELSNVTCTAYATRTAGDPPEVAVANAFERMKVVYTEYDSSGSSQGTVETQFRVQQNP